MKSKTFGRRNLDSPPPTPRAKRLRRGVGRPQQPKGGNGEMPEELRKDGSPSLEHLFEMARGELLGTDDGESLKAKPRSEVAAAVTETVANLDDREGFNINDRQREGLVSWLLNDLLGPAEPAQPEDGPVDINKTSEEVLAPMPTIPDDARKTVEDARDRIQPLLMDQIDASRINEISREELSEQISDMVSDLLAQEKLNLNLREQHQLVTLLMHEMLGLGPLEPLLADDTVNDIMVNGPDAVYVERKGKLELTDVKFRNSRHLMNIATRIVSRVGRRVDESTPMCDARLSDGSRVNVIIPPLAIDGISISIRKFSKQVITLDVMQRQKNLSPEMATMLQIIAACRLNVLISGGTGSGKTTLLNAMSQMIDHRERIVTIEDAAELQLQQPHVVRLETRPPSIEGTGEITMRDLVKNALRMRPDRIILGEIRSSEALDMLQAMNTGHDGSMSTIHSNSPRDALTRLENMVGMAGVNLPSRAIRPQIASAIHVIVQIARMRDGKRRIRQISEVVGMEGDVVTMQDLFKFEFKGEDENGNLFGDFEPTGVRPHFTPTAEYYGLDRALMSII